jgi:hypothetical protein
VLLLPDFTQGSAYVSLLYGKKPERGFFRVKTQHAGASRSLTLARGPYCGPDWKFPVPLNASNELNKSTEPLSGGVETPVVVATKLERAVA